MLPNPPRTLPRPVPNNRYSNRFLRTIRQKLVVFRAVIKPCLPSPEQIETLEAGPEIDALVDRIINGWEIFDPLFPHEPAPDGNGYFRWDYSLERCWSGEDDEPPRYSTDERLAASVQDQLHSKTGARLLLLALPDGWVAAASHPALSTATDITQLPPTPLKPLSICRAALRFFAGL